MDAGGIVQLLQRMVDGFAADVGAVQMGLAIGDTPDPARRPLAAALRYVLERFDLVPDHVDGLGVVDDAAVLRIAARHAVSYGADDGELRRLAGEAPALAAAFGDLFEPLEEYVTRLPHQALKGKTAGEVLADDETRVAMWQEVVVRVKTYQPHPLANHGAPEKVLKELRQMILPRLRKAGLVT
jgi:uncharacterized membrane protein YkvA (DUF1232 family)